MTKIIVTTDSGEEVDTIIVDDRLSDTAIAREVAGHLHPILGRLGRALLDARIIQQGGDPERASEKVMRLMQERRREE
jgi:hypothetical protein